MESSCCTKDCRNKATHGKMFCDICSHRLNASSTAPVSATPAVPEADHAHRRGTDTPMSVRYPKYYKPVPEGMKDIDIYALCMIFGVQDTSGALHHAIKKILLPGTRTGGKSRRDDIKEARDTLTRWLELHK